MHQSKDCGLTKSSVNCTGPELSPDCYRTSNDRERAIAERATERVVDAVLRDGGGEGEGEGEVEEMSFKQSAFGRVRSILEGATPDVRVDRNVAIREEGAIRTLHMRSI